MSMRFAIRFLTLAILLGIAGCSDKPSEPIGASSSEDFGGYTATDELPGFGRPELLASASDELAANDQMAYNPVVSAWLSDPRSARISFRSIWGQLRLDSSVTEATDWSGSLTLSRGAIVVKSLIRFEPGQDSLLERTDEALIEWTSFTTVHHDGISTVLIIPPPEMFIDTTFVVDTLGDTTVVIDTLHDEPATLSFETGPYSRIFTMDELISLDTIVVLDDSSSSLAFRSMLTTRERCDRGVLDGSWGFDDDGRGIFMGNWRNEEGEVEGSFRGHFTQEEDGRRFLFGKWIDASGRFEGFLKGGWKRNPNYHANPRAFERAGGKFRGSIYSADSLRIGSFEGRYKTSNGWRGSWLHGNWQVGCHDDRHGRDDDHNGDRGDHDDDDHDHHDGDGHGH